MARPTGKRGTFSFRVTPSLRALLEQAAGASERPVSEEIEARLQRSFDQDAARQLIRDEVRQAIREERDFGPRPDLLAGAGSAQGRRQLPNRDFLAPPYPTRQD